MPSPMSHKSRIDCILSLLCANGVLELRSPLRHRPQRPTSNGLFAGLAEQASISMSLSKRICEMRNSCGLSMTGSEMTDSKEDSVTAATSECDVEVRRATATAAAHASLGRTSCLVFLGDEAACKIQSAIDAGTALQRLVRLDSYAGRLHRISWDTSTQAPSCMRCGLGACVSRFRDVDVNSRPKASKATGATKANDASKSASSSAQGALVAAQAMAAANATALASLLQKRLVFGNLEQRKLANGDLELRYRILLRKYANGERYAQADGESQFDKTLEKTTNIERCELWSPRALLHLTWIVSRRSAAQRQWSAGTDVTKDLLSVTEEDWSTRPELDSICARDAATSELVADLRNARKRRDAYSARAPSLAEELELSSDELMSEQDEKHSSSSASFAVSSASSAVSSASSAVSSASSAVSSAIVFAFSVASTGTKK